MRWLLIVLLLGCAEPKHAAETAQPAPAAGTLRVTLTDRAALPRTGPVASGGAVFSTLRGPIQEVGYTPGGEGVVVTSGDQVVALLDATTGVLRAMHQLVVGSDSRLQLRGFDGSGTRLLVTLTRPEREELLVWDLRADTWKRVAEFREDRPAFATFVGEVVVHTKRRGLRVLPLSGEARDLLLGSFDEPAEEFAALTPIDNERLLAHYGESLHFVDVTAASVVARVEEGSSAVVRPQGGLVAVSIGESIRIFDARGEPQGVLARTRPHFTQDGLLSVGTPATRQLLDLRTGQVVAEGEPSGLRSDVQRRADEYARNGRNIVRYNLESEAQTTVFTLPEDADAIRSYALSPDGRGLAIATEARIHFVDARTGEANAEFVVGAGDRSVWGTRAADAGLVLWGRGWSQHWSAAGQRTTQCEGSGDHAEAVPLEATSAFVARDRACTDGRTFTARGTFLGVHESRVVDAVEGQFLLRDLRNGRVRSALRAPPGFTLECMGACLEEYVPVGPHAAILLNTDEGNWWLGRGVARKVNDGVATRFGALTAVHGPGGLTAYDRAGRAVRNVSGERFGPDPASRCGRSKSSSSADRRTKRECVRLVPRRHISNFETMRSSSWIATQSSGTSPRHARLRAFAIRFPTSCSTTEPTSPFASTSAFPCTRFTAERSSHSSGPARSPTPFAGSTPPAVTTGFAGGLSSMRRASFVCTLFGEATHS
ncbi:MAG: hypothetical protein AAGE52_05750 [Myxococcota bacterium]